MSRLVDYLQAITSVLKAAKDHQGMSLFKGVRVQLDPYDLDDIVKEGFAAPAARVLFTAAKPVSLATGSINLDVVTTIAIITKREGQPKPEMVSADAAALDLTLAVAQLVNDDPYFGVSMVSAAAQEGIKVAVSERANEKGLAVTVLMLRATLYEVVTERPLMSAVLETGRVQTPFEISEINGEPVPPGGLADWSW